jgi:hypothetical protein
MAGPGVGLRVTLGYVILTGTIDVAHERTVCLKAFHKPPSKAVSVKIEENLLLTGRV